MVGATWDIAWFKQISLRKWGLLFCWRQECKLLLNVWWIFKNILIKRKPISFIVWYLKHKHMSTGYSMLSCKGKDKYLQFLCLKAKICILYWSAVQCKVKLTEEPEPAMNTVLGQNWQTFCCLHQVSCDMLCRS